MTDRTHPDPAAEIPRAGRAARASVPGGPATSPAPTGVAGGKTSRQAHAPQAPVPAGTRAPSGAAQRGQAPRRGTPEGGADQAPAGRASDPSGGDERAPAGSTALSGEEWRKRVKDVTSAQHAEQRRRAARYVPKARRGVQAASGPGMVRRPPPLPPDGAA